MRAVLRARGLALDAESGAPGRSFACHPEHCCEEDSVGYTHGGDGAHGSLSL